MVGFFAAALVLLACFPLVERVVRQPMFDLALFRKPTFVGGLVAAFGMNGPLFAMFLFLVLYLQDVLHYSALQTGLRLLVITGAILLAAIPAGRLSTRLPARLLIGAGLLLVGAGLLLMRGLDPAQAGPRWFPASSSPASAPAWSTRRSPRPRSEWCRREQPAWPRGSTAPSARSASRPASPRSARSSRPASATPPAPRVPLPSSQD